MMQMPKQGLTPEQAKDVVEYLKSKDAGGASEEKEGSK
jgi:mono/diheme cytochrome c family protein